MILAALPEKSPTVGLICPRRDLHLSSLKPGRAGRQVHGKGAWEKGLRCLVRRSSVTVGPWVGLGLCRLEAEARAPVRIASGAFCVRFFTGATQGGRRGWTGRFRFLGDFGYRLDVNLFLGLDEFLRPSTFMVSRRTTSSPMKRTNSTSCGGSP